MMDPMMNDPLPNLLRRSSQLIWTWRQASCEPAGLRATPDSTEVTSWGRIFSRSVVASKYLKYHTKCLSVLSHKSVPSDYLCKMYVFCVSANDLIQRLFSLGIYKNTKL